MRKTSLLLFMSTLAVMAQNPAPSRPGLLMSFDFTGANQIQMLIGAVAKPPGGNLHELISMGGIASVNSGEGASRFVVDETHHQFFGYDISAETTSVAGEYRVTIAPLTWTPAKEQGQLTPVLLPKYPEPQIIIENDTIELDLL